MLTIICGEDSVSSRDYLLQLQKDYKSKDFEIVRLGPDELEQSVLNLSSRLSLFGQKRVFVTENLNKKISKKTNLKLVKLLEKISKNTAIELIDWEDGVSQRELKTGKLGKTKEFKPIQNIWQLLDSCYPANMPKFILLLNRLATSKNEMFIFIMLARHIRNLLLLKSGAGLPLLQPWQRAKLASQAKSWQEKELVLFYDKLIGIDIATKTGRNSYGLKDSIEVLACYYI